MGGEGEEGSGVVIGDDDEAVGLGERLAEAHVAAGVGLDNAAEMPVGPDGIGGHAAVPDGVRGEAVGRVRQVIGGRGAGERREDVKAAEDGLAGVGVAGGPGEGDDVADEVGADPECGGSKAEQQREQAQDGDESAHHRIFEF